MIYLLVILILAYGITQYDLKATKNIKYERFVIAILVMLAGLRYRIGTDSSSYEYWFERELPVINNIDFKNITVDFKYEPGFVVFSSLIKTFFGDWLWFQIITCSIINITVCRFLLRNTRYFYTAVLIYFFIFFYNANCESIRESLAICFFLLGYEKLQVGAILKYLIYIILGFTFHYSAIILLIVPLLRRLKPDGIIAIIIYVSLFFAGSALRLMYGDASAWLLVFTDGSNAALRVDNYVDSAYMSDTINLNTMILQLIHIIAFVYGLKFLRQIKIDIERIEPFMFLYLCFSVLYINIGIFYRFTHFFCIGAFIVAAEVICRYGKNTRVKGAPLLIMLTLCLSVYKSMTVEIFPGIKQRDVYLPYNSIIYKQENVKRELIYKRI